MNRVTNWLMSPSTLPKSPPWWLVFGACGVAYHAVVAAMGGADSAEHFAIACICAVPTAILFIMKK